MTRVTIELEGAEKPMLGTVRVESEAARPFVGWIGLLAALEAVLEPDYEGRDDLPPAESGG